MQSLLKQPISPILVSNKKGSDQKITLTDNCGGLVFIDDMWNMWTDDGARTQVTELTTRCFCFFCR